MTACPSKRALRVKGNCECVAEYVYNLLLHWISLCQCCFHGPGSPDLQSIVTHPSTQKSRIIPCRKVGDPSCFLHLAGIEAYVFASLSTQI